MGVYMLKFSVFHTSLNNKSVFAQPYNFISSGSDEVLGSKESHEKKAWSPAKIDDETDSFNTQGYLMRYYDE